MIEENDWRITDQTKYLARPIEKSSEIGRASCRERVFRAV